MLFQSDFKMDGNNREIFPVDALEFSYICNYAELDSYIEKRFPWHWHSAFEVDYIAEGEAELRTADGVTAVHKGEAFFVNSNVMHDIRAKNRGCIIYAHIFDMHFLSGMYNSIFEKKYLLPVANSRELQTFIIRPDSPAGKAMLERLLDSAKLSLREDFGYEFEVRAQLGRFWCMLITQTEELRTRSTTGNTADTDRLKLMMEYIHRHYMERITLSHIAAAASLSTRECTRCFGRCINTSPVNYLNLYRIRQAAALLLRTQDSILSISEACGFSSVSYFGKVFHKVMGCGAMEYRRDFEKPQRNHITAPVALPPELF